MLFLTEFPSPVGAKCAQQTDAAFGNTLRLCSTHDVGQSRQLFGLGAVVIALREDVAHVHLGRRAATGGAQWRSELASTLTTALVERRRGVPHTGLGFEAADHRLYLSHLWRPFRTHE